MGKPIGATEGWAKADGRRGGRDGERAWRWAEAPTWRRGGGGGGGHQPRGPLRRGGSKERDDSGDGDGGERGAGRVGGRQRPRPRRSAAVDAACRRRHAWSLARCPRRPWHPPVGGGAGPFRDARTKLGVAARERGGDGTGCRAAPTATRQQQEGMQAAAGRQEGSSRKAGRQRWPAGWGGGGRGVSRRGWGRGAEPGRRVTPPCPRRTRELGGGGGNGAIHYGDGESRVWWGS